MAVPAPAPSKLAYSDYTFVAASGLGLLAGYQFFLQDHPALAGYVGLASTFLYFVTKFLQSKGD